MEECEHAPSLDPPLREGDNPSRIVTGAGDAQGADVNSRGKRHAIDAAWHRSVPGASQVQKLETWREGCRSAMCCPLTDSYSYRMRSSDGPNMRTLATEFKVTGMRTPAKRW